MAKANKKNSRSRAAEKTRDDVKPKRKIGRYVLAVLISVPLVAQLRNIEVSWDLPQMTLPELVLPQVSMPEVSMPDVSMPEISMPGFSIADQVAFTNIVIEGEFKYSSKRHLQEQLSLGLNTGFVRLDLSDIQTLLLKNNWYRNVSVSRVWPSSLKVEIEEEQPIARWNDNGFINRHGEIIRVKDLAVLDHLPVLEGNDENAYDIAKNYLTMAQLMSDQSLFITKLSVTSDGDWSAEINHTFGVELGRRHLSERIERFLFLYTHQLEELSSDLKRIDMRYQSGVAVEWLDTPPRKHITNDNDIASR